MPVTNGISPGICAMDYVGDGEYPNPDTPGLIVDDVSCRLAVDNPYLFANLIVYFLRSCMKSW